MIIAIVLPEDSLRDRAVAAAKRIQDRAEKITFKDSPAMQQARERAFHAGRAGAGPPRR